MENLLNKIRRFNIIPYLLIFYTVGIVGLIFPQSRELFKALVPVNLLLNIALLLIYHGQFKKGFLWKAGLIFIAGILVEVVGVQTGIIFGEYYYGPTLGPKILGTPLMIGVNWLMLVYCTLAIISKFTDVPYFRILLASTMMVVYDIVLEPSAIALDMWSWDGPLPMQNYIAWFFISFFLILFAERSRLVNQDNKVAPALYFIQFCFFILLNLWFYTV